MNSLLVVFGVVVGSVVALQEQRYVFDMYRNAPPLDSEAVIDLLSIAQPGVSFPLNNKVPNTGFDCAAQETPGYFADPAPPSMCQAFYRCEINGNQMGFLCPNQTLFNQLTLTCDYYFNVDCAGSRNLYNFANSRLYQPGQPLFDTPPKGYISLLSGISGASGRSDDSAPVVQPVVVVQPAVVVQPVAVQVVQTPRPPLRPVVGSVVIQAKPAAVRVPSTAATTSTAAPAILTEVVVEVLVTPAPVEIQNVMINMTGDRSTSAEVLLPASNSTEQVAPLSGGAAGPTSEVINVSGTPGAESAVVVPQSGGTNGSGVVVVESSVTQSSKNTAAAGRGVTVIV